MSIVKKIYLNKLIKLILFLLPIVLFGCKANQHPARNIQLNPLFTDNMVLQQNQDIPIWGTSEPDGIVTITFNNEKIKTIADDDGNWKVMLKAQTAGGPYEISIQGEESLTIKNVMIGEVWICSGQSNMEWPVGSYGKVKNYEEEIANADFPNIRLLSVEKSTANTPQKSFNSEGWKECSPQTVDPFSAAAYFFGRYIHKELDVPVGLIQTAWGGTIIEAWTSALSLKKFPEFTEIINSIESDNGSDEERAIAAKKKINEWPDKIEQILKEHKIFESDFQKVDYNTENWKTMKLPSTWEDAGLDVDGVVWFSKVVSVPENWNGDDLILSLGKINDFDITWFNGEKVGRGIDADELRKYKIKSSIVKTGENIITVAVLDIGNVGGLYGLAKDMKLINGKEFISVVGEWKFKVDPNIIDVRKLPVKPSINSGANRPTVLYNGMINPLIPYGIRGAIWYQGEANAERAYQYRTLFKTLIKDWRNIWEQGDFPFLFVQLASFKDRKSQPDDDSWAELREAQTMALELPNTGMAVTIDIGEAKNIHPKNKQDVGKRLALNALAKVYGRQISYSGPLYKSMKIEGNKIRLQFANTDKGLKTNDNKKLKGFAIAGKGKIFIWADAEIKGNNVIVWNSKIKDPVAVRYAWASNPICNLYNGIGLPASPFRTDDWEGITYGKK